MMSGWETSSIVWFSIIAGVSVLVGWFVVKFIEAYPIVKAEMEAKANEEPHAMLKNLPVSMKENGNVNFTHHSIEEIGMHDSKPIHKFYVDDHGIYWVFDGVADPLRYYQPKDDGTVRIFIGKCLYTPMKTTKVT